MNRLSLATCSVAGEQTKVASVTPLATAMVECGQFVPGEQCEAPAQVSAKGRSSVLPGPARCRAIANLPHQR
jgi:hypothetical protein